MNVHDVERTAGALAQARLTATRLEAFPGDLPRTVDEAYEIQDAVIRLRAGTTDTVTGWKVGLIAPERREQAMAERLVGPIFRSATWTAEAGRTARLPVIPGGTACVEAEIVMTVGRDVPLGVGSWSIEDASAYLGGIGVAVELAGSPVPAINGLGPMAVASDLGNNAGLLVGPQIDDWQSGAWEHLACSTWVDGELVGSAEPSKIPGGAIEAFRFALATCSRRGHVLQAGDRIATGAVTGIHDVVVGQEARITFGDIYQFDLETVEA